MRLVALLAAGLVALALLAPAASAETSASICAGVHTDAQCIGAYTSGCFEIQCEFPYACVGVYTYDPGYCRGVQI